MAEFVKKARKPWSRRVSLLAGIIVLTKERRESNTRHILYYALSTVRTLFPVHLALYLCIYSIATDEKNPYPSIN